MRRQVILPDIFSRGNSNEVALQIENRYSSPSIEVGELVIDYASGSERLFIRNSEGRLVPFMCSDSVMNEIASASGSVVSFIVNEAPETFDTLKEISDWISSHSGETISIIKDIHDISGSTSNSVGSIVINETTGEISVNYNDGRVYTSKIGYYLSIKESQDECTAVGDGYVNEDDGYLYTFNGSGFDRTVKMVGEDGAQGPQGAEGAQGPKGEDGRQGVDGAQGVQGPKGEDGRQGIDGAQGVQGPKGVDGEQGIDGVQGVQGTQGNGIASITFTRNENPDAVSWSGRTGGEVTILETGSEVPRSVRVYDGERGPQGIAPQLRVTEDGNVESSYDGGQTWTFLGQARFEEGATNNYYSTNFKGTTAQCTTIGDVSIDPADGHIYEFDGTQLVDTGISVKGPQGYQGQAGTDVSSVDVTDVTGGKQLTIGLSNGITSSFTLTNGVDGNDGVGVSRLETARTDNAVTYITYLTDGSHSAITVYDGTDGVTPQIEVRADGNVYVSYDGGTSWNNVGTAHFEEGATNTYNTYALNVKGNAADCTADGDAYIDGNGVLQIYINGAFTPSVSLKGPRGIGVTTVTTARTGSAVTFTTIMSDGSTSAVTVYDGVGIDSIVGTSYDGSHAKQTVTITKSNGETESFDYYNGTDGKNGRSIAGISGTVVMGNDIAVNIEYDDETPVSSFIIPHGLSAYEVWLQSNPGKTRDEFFASLVGAQGVQGPKGTNGENGNDGASTYFIPNVDYVSIDPQHDAWSASTSLFPTTPKAGDLVYELRTNNDGDTNDVEAYGYSVVNVSENAVYLQEVPSLDKALLSVKDGTDGKQGIQGPKGADGANGTNGTDGVQGRQGPSGIDGTNGVNGTDGAQGVQGPIGNQGIPGTSAGRGDQGIQGPSGADGTNGANGTDGAQGRQGPKGLDGTNGSNGTDGAQGRQGPKGVDGTNGSNGTDGAQGRQGPKGADGTSGSNGDDGAQGRQGPRGTNGTSGSNGDDGAQGRQGPSGADGADGSSGTNGAQGRQGPSGSNGTNGARGNSVYPWSTESDWDDGADTISGVDDVAAEEMQIGDMLIGELGGVYEVTDVDAAGPSVDLIYRYNIKGPQGPRGYQGPGGNSASMSLTNSTAKAYILGWDDHNREVGVYDELSYETSTWYESGLIYATSDERLKNFGKDVEVDFDKLEKLPKKYFTWKDDKDGVLNIGTSAQKLAEIYPEIVSVNDDVYGVSYERLSIIALAAIDKLHKENEELKERIKRLEEKLGL